MNETKHTPEPWHTGGIFNPATNPTTSIWGPTPAGRQSGDWIAKEVSKANARRIVACVNACAGMPTDRIENVAELGGFDAVALRGGQLIDQRDELAAALRDIVQLSDLEMSDGDGARSIALSALAKAQL